MKKTTSCGASWMRSAEPLKEELDAYAAEHGKLYGPIETVALIPHMLEAFIRADRGWRSRRKRSERVRIAKRRGGPASDTTPADPEGSN
ncbi:MAG: DUF2274 domain-containing protein [Methylobacteriaceae bacterium]|nr:DUF2274 domain-containing protein [Methylobacteriaceae bacterium]